MVELFRPLDNIRNMLRNNGRNVETRIECEDTDLPGIGHLRTVLVETSGALFWKKEKVLAKEVNVWDSKNIVYDARDYELDVIVRSTQSLFPDMNAEAYMPLL